MYLKYNSYKESFLCNKNCWKKKGKSCRINSMRKIKMKLLNFCLFFYIPFYKSVMWQIANIALGSIGLNHQII
jgi:hypothetical protein